MSSTAPIGPSERINQIDVIRGFALFGVLLMNLSMQRFWLAPSGAFDDLPTSSLDALIEPVESVLFGGKAVTLFSLLFGFGFAMMMHRLGAVGADGQKTFLRRLAILLVIGLLHAILLWFGDILSFYALMGFVLLLTRRWSDRTLLIVGLTLALLSIPVTKYLCAFLFDKPYPWWELVREGAVRRFEIFQESNYVAYVTENWRLTSELWGNPYMMAYLLPTTLGRFMLGAWIYRQGWFDNLPQYKSQIHTGSVILVSIGIVIATLIYFFPSGTGLFGPLAELILGTGYGLALVALYHSKAVRSLFSGFAAVGRMALTSYLMQSLAYVFILFGFGLGLLRVLGATTCLVIAVVVFAVQMAFSQWWLRRFRFGPVEWVWRSLTYGEFQPLRAQQIA